MDITFKDIQASAEIRTYITQADAALSALGYTEHAFAHVGRCVDTVRRILGSLGYDERTIELGKIAAYMHDIGNLINRDDHAQSGALMAFHILDKMGMDPMDISVVISAIGHHDDTTAFPVSPVAAALLLADKTDVRRSRVRTGDTIHFDIHDRVNYAAESSEVLVDIREKTVTLHLTINREVSAVMEYFEIFLHRMLLCRKSAEYLHLTFHLVINGQWLL